MIAGLFMPDRVAAQPPAPQFHPYTLWCSYGGTTGGGACTLCQPYGLAVGDLLCSDGDDCTGPDGWPDVVVANSNDLTQDGERASVSIFVNTRDWTPHSDGLRLHTRIAFSFETPARRPLDVALGDVDGDQRVDIVVGLERGRLVAIIRQYPEGVFTLIWPGFPLQFTGKSLGHFDLAVSDFDQLYGPDVMVSGRKDTPTTFEPRVEWLRHSGGWPPFEPPHVEFRIDDHSQTFGEPAAVSASRFRTGQPGYLDLVTGSRESPQLFVMPNDQGAFNENFVDPDGGAPGYGLTDAWLRPGTLRDLALTDYGNACVRISLNEGNGEFALTEEPLRTDPIGLYSPWGIAPGHLNDDNLVDVVAACQYGTGGDVREGGVAVFVARDAAGNFAVPGYPFAVDDVIRKPNPRKVQIADLDRDGDNDVVVTCYGSSVLSVLLNRLKP